MSGSVVSGHHLVVLSFCFAEIAARNPHPGEQSAARKDRVFNRIRIFSPKTKKKTIPPMHVRLRGLESRVIIVIP